MKAFLRRVSFWIILEFIQVESFFRENESAIFNLENLDSETEIVCPTLALKGELWDAMVDLNPNEKELVDYCFLEDSTTNSIWKNQEAEIQDFESKEIKKVQKRDLSAQISTDFQAKFAIFLLDYLAKLEIKQVQLVGNLGIF